MSIFIDIIFYAFLIGFFGLGAAAGYTIVLFLIQAFKENEYGY